MSAYTSVICGTMLERSHMGPLTLYLCVLTFAEHAAARPTPIIRQDDMACLNKEAPADGRDTHHSTMRNTSPPMRPRTHPETQQRRPRDARPPVARRARPLQPKASTHPPQGAPTRLVPPIHDAGIQQHKTRVNTRTIP